PVAESARQPNRLKGTEEWPKESRSIATEAWRGNGFWPDTEGVCVRCRRIAANRNSRESCRVFCGRCTRVCCRGRHPCARVRWRMLLWNRARQRDAPGWGEDHRRAGPGARRGGNPGKKRKFFG